MSDECQRVFHSRRPCHLCVDNIWISLLFAVEQVFNSPPGCAPAIKEILSRTQNRRTNAVVCLAPIELESLFL